MTTDQNDWDSRAPAVQRDQLAAYDAMRARFFNDTATTEIYTLFRHEDVSFALAHPEIFSSRVSTRHIAVPSGMDAPEHTAFRAINDRYYTAERMAGFAPSLHHSTPETPTRHQNARNGAVLWAFLRPGVTSRYQRTPRLL